jgi:hypothetical protein
LPIFIAPIVGDVFLGVLAELTWQLRMTQPRITAFHALSYPDQFKQLFLASSFMCVRWEALVVVTQFIILFVLHIKKEK